MQKQIKKTNHQKQKKASLGGKKIDIIKILSKVPRNRPLNEMDIQKFAKHIPFFIGTRMRDEFKDRKCQTIEAAVANLNLTSEPGILTYLLA